MWLYRQVCLYAAAPVVLCAPFAAAHVARAVQYAAPDAASCQRFAPQHPKLPVQSLMLRLRRWPFFRKEKKHFDERWLLL